MKENKEEAAAKMKEVKAKMANKLKSFFWIYFYSKILLQLQHTQNY